MKVLTVDEELLVSGGTDGGGGGGRLTVIHSCTGDPDTQSPTQGPTCEPDGDMWDP